MKAVPAHRRESLRLRQGQWSERSAGQALRCAARAQKKQACLTSTRRARPLPRMSPAKFRRGGAGRPDRREDPVGVGVRAECQANLHNRTPDVYLSRIT